MSRSPRITIILPSLNVVDYISETLTSVINQTLEDIEILCVDAGSEDGTLDIIREAAEKDARIRIIMSKKKSYGYQVNLGIDNAEGEYIAVLETDDYVEPSMYERLYEIAKANAVDYAKADYNAFFTQKDGAYYFFPRQTFKDDFFYERVISPRDYITIGRDDWYLWQGIYARDFLNNNNIRFSETPGAAFQDIGFLFWTGAYAKRVMYIRDCLYHYRIDREGASSNIGKALDFSYIEFCNIAEKMQMLELSDDRIRGLLYARMIKSFVSAYRHTFKDEEESGARREAYEWFKKELKYAMDSGYVLDEYILPGHIDRLKCLLESEDEYFHRYSVKGFYDYILNKTDFIIFGCGDFGYRAYSLLVKEQKQVNCFLDNNSKIWGKKINGISICDPICVRRIPDNVYIIIANEVYHDDIKQQLSNYGVEANRMYVFR